MNEIKLENIIDASDLKSLNDLLTQVMKKQQIQLLIRNEDLGRVVDAIMDLASFASDEEELFAAAMLGRLAAVARGRETEVYSRAPELFTLEPPSIETLADGDEKEYAAKIIAFSKAYWLPSYCAREALAIDTANNARKELLRILINESDNLSDGLRLLKEEDSVLRNIEQADSRIKRVRRIFDSLAEVVRSYEGDVGREPGTALAELSEALMSDLTNADVDALHASMDAAIAVLVRVIELRFSHALHAETYQLLQGGKRMFTIGKWSHFLQASTMIKKVQMNLLETALVLARQNRTDKEILRAMESSWTSIHQIGAALKHHFAGASDIDPEVAQYWLKVGRVSQNERAAEHKLGNTEDQQIGELLIQLDANRDNMNKLNRAVVPVLETFDPIQAATVRRAANGYESIAQVAERIARMRKLSKTDIVATVVEYNPVEHDMEGGHRSGVRKVKVVRDGILKEFGGKIKTLVKPRVEAEE